MQYTTYSYSNGQGQRKQKREKYTIIIPAEVIKPQKQIKGMWYIAGTISYASDRRLGES